jgi:hypothetical protein
LEFLVFQKEKQTKRKEKKQKRENYLHGKTPNKQKEEQGNIFGFSPILQLIKLRRKNQKEARKYFWIFSKFFKHTKRK